MKFVFTLFAVLIFGCQSNNEILPILSYNIDQNGEKINYAISYENFTNQLGESFSTKNIKSKVFIANFFFTLCPSICPPMRNELIKIAKTFENKDDFLIISHTIDPENDSIEVLKNYSETTDISPEKWQFVRSTINNTKRQASQFMTNFKSNEDGTDFYHSSYVALVDKNQQIRGFYNVLVEKEVDRLKTDVKRLLE